MTMIEKYGSSCFELGGDKQMISHQSRFARLISGLALLSAVGAGPMFGMSADSAMAGNEAAKISVDAIGHWHVYSSKTLSFAVTNVGSNSRAKPNPVVEITHVGTDRVTVLTAKDGKVVNKGSGKYTFEYMPSNIGSYAMVVKVAIGDRLAVSSPVAVEVVRAGDEGIKASAQGTDYVYQIRYNWNPGYIHANPTERIRLVFELMRGLQRGAEINWDKPWRNRFDHVTGATTVTAILTSEDGVVIEKMNCIYLGKGIYEASRIFNSAEVGRARNYKVQLNFVDPTNGANVKSPRAYGLRAVQVQ